jgi:hypothetical protein
MPLLVFIDPSVLSAFGLPLQRGGQRPRVIAQMLSLTGRHRPEADLDDRQLCQQKISDARGRINRLIRPNLTVLRT